jgi:NADPH2:quinone reductase
MSFEDAAAAGLVYQTSYVALVHRANLRADETLLVHAAAGGVGLAAVQIGAALGARVIGTAGTKEKLELVAENGADFVVNYREGDWVSRVKELTDGRGADVIYDPVGGDTFDASTKCIAFEGRILIVGFASGRIPTAAMNRVLLKNFSLVGIHWGLYFDEDPEVLHESQVALSRLYAEGKIKPVVSETFPLKDAKSALAALGSRKTTGKIVLVPY